MRTKTQARDKKIDLIFTVIAICVAVVWPIAIYHFTTVLTYIEFVTIEGDGTDTATVGEKKDITDDSPVRLSFTQPYDLLDSISIHLGEKALSAISEDTGVIDKANR